ncbi:hypothetical protein LCGC14_2323490 [marine sediment metagenome]|uniref:Uncharacterized protein n=1 Tax=marine sediment metagenome TaxID=412755 RepID=A0A0F9CH39_9ZZZZ
MSDCIFWSYDAVAAKDSGKDFSITDIAIMRRSARLIHTEFQFSRRHNPYSGDRYGVCFSSTLRDGAEGCRFESIDFTRHPKRWNRILLPMTNEQEDRAYAKAQALNGKKYDLIGLASFASSLNIIKPHPDKLWCTEAVLELCKAAYGWDITPHLYHPLSGFFEVYSRVNSE